MYWIMTLVMRTDVRNLAHNIFYRRMCDATNVEQFSDVEVDPAEVVVTCCSQSGNISYFSSPPEKEDWFFVEMQVMYLQST